MALGGVEETESKRGVRERGASIGRGTHEATSRARAGAPGLRAPIS